MPDTLNVYPDSDVLISSQLSRKGAARLLLYNRLEGLKFHTSHHTSIEFLEIMRRDKVDYDQDIFQNFEIVEKFTPLKEPWQKFITDVEDLHILTGAINSKSKYILTYNIRDFKIDVIKTEFDILIMRPGQFLSYLRLLGLFK